MTDYFTSRRRPPVPSEFTQRNGRRANGSACALAALYGLLIIVAAVQLARR